MNNQIQVVPAIIAEDFNHLLRQIDIVKGFVPLVQVDVMDGVFAPTLSWPRTGDEGEFEDIVAGDRVIPGKGEVKFEVDLMVDTPEHEIDDWIKSGASSVIVHASSTDKHASIKENLTEFDVHMGIAFRPSDELDVDLLKLANFVQLMGNDKIGYHGVELDERVYGKAERLRDMYPQIDISVDIGVNEETAPRLIESGVNKLVSGSYIFNSADIEGAINKLGAKS